MNKLYLLQHIVTQNFSKHFLAIKLMLLFTIPIADCVHAQCNNTNASGTATAPTAGNTVQINACAFAGDYSTINGVAASTSYTLNSSATNDVFTIRQGSPGGPVVAFGITPLTWTATTAGTYYAHVNSYYGCGIQATCRTTSITGNGACTPPIITITPNTTCGGTCVPITASGADSYNWYPYAGLFLDCAATVPYQGGNATSVYTRPLTNTVYTVTGKVNATGCTGTTTATVNYTPGAPRILPNPAYACVGGIPVKLRTTSPGTLQYCSGTVNIPVPDNNPAGVFNTIAVSGTPTDCSNVGVSVVINMTHSRIGDMVFALKAPNGQVINLDYFISGTGGSGASTGFVNTSIASNISGSSLSSGTDPYTGTFEADLRVGATAGPTGMQPTSTSWQNLFSSLNGSWTLGMYDGVGNMTGVLNSWCMKLTFPCATTGDPNASPATWTPITGLYTDANATQAYTGIPIDSVWVKPTVAGAYTYQATTRGIPPGSPVCTSLPGSVTVYIGNPVTITSQPANQNVCSVNAAALFFVSIAAGAGPVTYQWQVSGNGINWFNLSNGGAYSGSNTGTLTINPVNSSMNGYRYRVLLNGGTGCSGAVSSAALLTIGQLPVVTNHPVNQTICSNGMINFAVTASGPGALTYQWQVSTNGGSTWNNITNAAPYSGVTYCHTNN